MPLMTVAQLAEHFRISRQYLYTLSKQDWFPQPAGQLGGATLYDFDAVDAAVSKRPTRRESEAFFPDGKERKRPHVGAVRLTSLERQYFIRMYGSTGAALRHLVNEEMKTASTAASR